jgi:hypothetical protein
MSIRTAIPEPTSSDTEYNHRSLPPYRAALRSSTCASDCSNSAEDETGHPVKRRETTESRGLFHLDFGEVVSESRKECRVGFRVAGVPGSLFEIFHEETKKFCAPARAVVPTAHP